MFRVRVMSPRNDMPGGMRGRGWISEEDVALAITGTLGSRDASDLDVDDRMKPSNADLKNENAGPMEDKCIVRLIKQGLAAAYALGIAHLCARRLGGDRAECKLAHAFESQRTVNASATDAGGVAVMRGDLETSNGSRRKEKQLSGDGLLKGIDSQCSIIGPDRGRKGMTTRTENDENRVKPDVP